MKKNRIIILTVIVILIAVYFAARKGRPIEREVRFFSADSASIGKLEFISMEDTIIVHRQKDEWKLTYPLQWDVNEQQLGYFFNQVLGTKTSTTPMSEDPNLQSMYKVDEQSAIQVKIYNKNNKLLDHAFIGNGTDTTFDYGRRKGEQKIYQFKNNIFNLVRPDILQWRSPKITNLKRRQIDRIEVTYTKNAYTLTVFADSMIYTDKRESFTIPSYNRAQHRVINALENMLTWQFVDTGTEQYEQDFKNPDCRIVVYLKNNETKSFTLISKSVPREHYQPSSPPQDTTILMMINDDMSTLYSMTGDFINRFTRASMHFKLGFD